MRLSLLCLAVIAALSFRAVSEAQEFLPNYSLERAKTWELGLGARWLESQTINFPAGSSIKLDKNTAFGFAFAYNFNSHFGLGASFDGFDPNYDANIASSNPSQGSTRFRANVRLTSVMLDGTYNLLRGPFTPYVTGGVGFMNVDADVPRGPPVYGCWWDPWYGYICGYFLPTKQEDKFAYRGELGLRWDITPFFFIRTAYGRTWLDVGHGASNTNLDVWKIDLGFRP